ncbi:MAG: hypothetical protein IK041_07050, partial [Bacteroidales bacterium]|nr:hypothetical protein [Bacteroidales bacterium]
HVKLIDFGFSAHHSYSELKGGTRKYSAPEQFSPVSESDIRADVYALGKVLVEMGASGKFMRVAKKASSEEPAMRYSSIKQMQNALRPDNTLWYILGILAVLLLAGMPFLKPLILPEQRNPIVDTLVVKDTLILRDTVYSEPKAMEPTPADRYRELVRREFGKIFKSFYESYSEITDENRSELRNGYGLCVDKAMELSDKMSAEWSKRYPSYNAEFEKISGEELMGVCNRYSRDLNRYDALSRQSGL